MAADGATAAENALDPTHLTYTNRRRNESGLPEKRRWHAVRALRSWFDFLSLTRQPQGIRRTNMMGDPFESAKDEHDRIYDALKTFAAQSAVVRARKAGRNSHGLSWLRWLRPHLKAATFSKELHESSSRFTAEHLATCRSECGAGIACPQR
jgi:hypothetical protein